MVNATVTGRQAASGVLYRTASDDECIRDLRPSFRDGELNTIQPHGNSFNY